VRMNRLDHYGSCDGYSLADLVRVDSEHPGSVEIATTVVCRWASRGVSGMHAKLDRLVHTKAASCSVRFAADDTRVIRIGVIGTYSIQICAAGGWLLLPSTDECDSYWLPQIPTLRMLNEVEQIIDERPAELTAFTASGSELAVQFIVPRGWALDFVAWHIPPSAHSLRDELCSLTYAETQAHFLWGSHTTYRRPADLYAHLIYGNIYENRRSWPKYRKIFSENDAHAIYVVLSGLEQTTGKQIYGFLKAQLLVSVLARQDDDGGWRHGEWTDRMESHFRLHCSGMHLLMDVLDERQDLVVRSALEHAADYLSRQTDKLDTGVWFLHDELEHSVETMRNGPFRWIPSRALGKSESNMLVLNSHIDASVALSRYRKVAGDVRHEDVVRQALAATRAVLSLRPADRLYRLIFQAVRLTLLPSSQAARLPLHLRALKRLAWKYLIPILPRLKAMFPRMVMPGGYIERELSLRLFAHEYLPVNLMDLLRFRRQFRDPSVDPIVEAGMRLVHQCSMFERWQEIKGKEYAIGFWAEALYHACEAYAAPEYRKWLAQAVLTLHALQWGLPPSLLGANCEVVPHREQVPAPMMNDSRVSIVNLSRRGHLEFLIVNISLQPARPAFLRNAPKDLKWVSGSDFSQTHPEPPEIPPQGWIWGQSGFARHDAA